MLEKVQKNLEKIMHKDYAYLVVCMMYLMWIYGIIFTIAYIYNFIPFVVLSIFTFEKIRKYVGGFHMHDNISCILFTIPLIITISYIAKQTQDTLWIVFLICLICMKDIYSKAPLFYYDVDLEKRWYNCKPFIYLPLKREKLNIAYDYKWHRIKAFKSMSTSFLLAIIFLTLEHNLLCSYVLWNIIMVDLLLFENKD